MAYSLMDTSGGFDNNGIFKRLYNWTADKNMGIKILSEKMDAECDNFKSGFDNCLTRDGKGKITEPFNFNGLGGLNLHTDLNDTSAPVNVESLIVDPTRLFYDISVLDTQITLSNGNLATAARGNAGYHFYFVCAHNMASTFTMEYANHTNVLSSYPIVDSKGDPIAPGTLVQEGVYSCLIYTDDIDEPISKRKICILNTGGGGGGTGGRVDTVRVSAGFMSVSTDPPFGSAISPVINFSLDAFDVAFPRMKYITTPDNYLKITESSTVDNVYFLTADPAAIVSSLGNTVRAISSNDKDPITALSRLTITDPQTSNPKIAINCPLVKSVSSADDFIEITGSTTDPLIGIKDGAIVKSVSSADTRVGVIGTPAEPEIKLNVNVVESITSDDERVVIEGTVNPKISLSGTIPNSIIGSSTITVIEPTTGNYAVSANPSRVLTLAPTEPRTFVITNQADMTNALTWASGFSFRETPVITLQMANPNQADFNMNLNNHGQMYIKFTNQDLPDQTRIRRLNINNEGSGMAVIDGLHCIRFVCGDNDQGFYRLRNFTYSSLTRLQNIEESIVQAYNASRIYIEETYDFSAARFGAEEYVYLLEAGGMSEIFWNKSQNRLHDLPHDRYVYFGAPNGGKLIVQGAMPTNFDLSMNICEFDTGVVIMDGKQFLPQAR